MGNRQRNTPLTVRNSHSSLRPVTRANDFVESLQATKKDVEKLRYLNDYLQMAIKKKDEMLAVVIEENKELHEKIAQLEITIKQQELHKRNFSAYASNSSNGNSKPDVPKYQKTTTEDLTKNIKSRLGSIGISGETKTAVTRLKSILQKVTNEKRKCDAD